MHKPTLDQLRAAVKHKRMKEAELTGAAAAGPALASAPRTGNLPLSWAQQRLWFLEQLEPQAGLAYLMPAGLRLRGQLDRVALEAALERIVARHEVLRTAYREDEEGRPYQLIGPADQGLCMSQADLTGLNAQGRARALAEAMAAEAATPFDLAAGRPIRARLLRCGPDEHVLLLTMHHLVADGWSVGVLVRELGMLYTAFSRGAPDPLPPLAVQYADYALWQRAWLAGARLERQLGYWTGQLAGAPAQLALPLDRPRAPSPTYAGAECQFMLPAELVARLQALSQRHGLTLFMTLLTGWALLLARLSQQDDVVIGTPIANRIRRELEPLMGLFVNMLPLRLRIDPDASVAALMDRVKETALEAFAHQDVPFERVVEAVQPERAPGSHPLFQVTFGLDNTPTTGRLQLDGLEVDSMPPAQDSSTYDLALALAARGERVLGVLTYASALFDPASAQAIGARFLTVLEAMAADPSQSVGRVALLSDDERERVLRTFNDSAVADTPQEPVYRQFERLAAAQPRAAALVCGARTFSYAELNECANRVAHALRARGAGPEQPVALLAARNEHSVIGMLGIWKAGAAYVPLDPALPPERLAYMLADCGATLVLAGPGAHPPLPPGLPAPIDIDAIARDTQTDTHDPAPAALAHTHLAYVMYTSGSTGRPKGVMVEHAAFANFIHAMRRLLASVPGDVLLAVTTFSFDIAGLELHLPLASGACIVLAEAHDQSDPVRLAALIALHGVNLMQATPAGWRMLVDSGWQGTPGLRALCGGEALPPALAAALAPRVGRLWNLYGPTETTVWSTCAEWFPGQPVTIGRPIDNTQVYVLDRLGAPQPVGVSGELWIGGAGLARGYLGLDVLSAERFVHHPFEPGARLYRTGDLGRWRADGLLECHGRNDSQVKLRGFRIELGEIEARLCALPGVHEAAVVAQQSGAGETRLVGFVVTHPGQPFEPEALRAGLARLLPVYMLPAAFKQLEALPLTPNGKLDRTRLLEHQVANARAPFEAPHGPTERRIGAIWQTLLEVDQVGRHDHFFALGGHSLLAIQLASRIQASFGLRLPLRELFLAPSLASLGGRLDTALAEQKQEAMDKQAQVEQQLRANIDNMSHDELKKLLAARRAAA